MWALVIGTFLVAYGVVAAFVHGAATVRRDATTILDRDHVGDQRSHRDAA